MKRTKEKAEEQGKTRDESKRAEDDQKVPFYKLFSFADQVDVVLMIVGTIAAIGSGISVPLMTLIFGQIIDAFGSNSDTPKVVDSVSKIYKRGRNFLLKLVPGAISWTLWLERNVRTYNHHFKDVPEIMMESRIFKPFGAKRAEMIQTEAQLISNDGVNG